jgi:hypothetical protein
MPRSRKAKKGQAALAYPQLIVFFLRGATGFDLLVNESKPSTSQLLEFFPLMHMEQFPGNK